MCSKKLSPACQPSVSAPPKKSPPSFPGLHQAKAGTPPERTFRSMVDCTWGEAGPALQQQKPASAGFLFSVFIMDQARKAVTPFVLRQAPVLASAHAGSLTVTL